MNIVLDYQAAIGKRAGIGQYIYHLSNHLAIQAVLHQIYIAYFDFKKIGKNLEIPANLIACRSALPGRLMSGLWKYFDFPDYGWIFQKGDLYHFPNFIIRPLHHGKAVVTIHDLSFLRFPEFAEKKNLKFLTSQLNKTLDRADAVIADSYFTKRELVQLTKYPDDKIHVIHLGLDLNLKRDTSPLNLANMKTKYELPEKYFLFMGTIEPRKNIMFLLKAFAEWARKYPDMHLVLAGMYGWNYAQIMQYWQGLSLKNRIHFIGYIPETDKAALYSFASALIFPSLYEGFGFPPLEAMLCQTPVICSRAESLVEIADAHVHYIDNQDVENLKEAMEHIYQNKMNINLNVALQHARSFTWSKTARQTLAVYDHVLNAK